MVKVSEIANQLREAARKIRELRTPAAVENGTLQTFRRISETLSNIQLQLMSASQALQQRRLVPVLRGRLNLLTCEQIQSEVTIPNALVLVGIIISGFGVPSANPRILNYIESTRVRLQTVLPEIATELESIADALEEALEAGHSGVLR